MFYKSGPLYMKLLIIIILVGSEELGKSMKKAISWISAHNEGSFLSADPDL